MYNGLNGLQDPEETGLNQASQKIHIWKEIQNNLVWNRNTITWNSFQCLLRVKLIFILFFTLVMEADLLVQVIDSLFWFIQLVRESYKHMAGL